MWWKGLGGSALFRFFVLFLGRFGNKNSYCCEEYVSDYYDIGCLKNKWIFECKITLKVLGFYVQYRWIYMQCIEP